MRAFFFGSRNATPKWWEATRQCVLHAMLQDPPDLADWMAATELDRSLHWRSGLLPVGEPLVFIHGDGPPGESRDGVRCPIGLDRLVELVLAADPNIPRHVRVKRFPVDQKPGEAWGTAALRRNAQAVGFGAERAYCIHTDLDSSRGSAHTASMLKDAERPFYYVRLTQAGKLVGVEVR